MSKKGDDLKKYFKVLVINNFKKLDNYHLKLTNEIDVKSGISLSFQNNFCGVTFVLDFSEGLIFLWISRLINGKLPETSLNIDEHTDLNRIDFLDLIKLRNKDLQIPRFSPDELVFNEDCKNNIATYTNFLFDNLESLAKDIFKGNFGCVFDDLKKIVVDRIKNQ